MPAFEYKAIDKTGGTSRGRIDAANDVDLELRLKRMGLDLITFRARRTRSNAGTAGQIPRRDLITFCYDMEQISRAGIPIIDALRDLRDSIADRRFREVVSAMLEDIEGGKMLSQAMTAFPQIFSPVFVSLIRAGEQSGQMTEVFQNLGATLKWQDELASQTKRLLMYPALVFIVVSLVSLFLLMYLVPKVVALFKTMGMALPLQTRFVIAASDFLLAYWWVLAMLLIVAAIALPVMLRTNPRVRDLADYLVLRLPVVGDILQKIILARFANFFALMYRSGITVLDSIRAGQDIVGNRYIGAGIERAWQQINAGESLSEAFQNLGMFPPLVVRMLRIGENTGALDTALMNVTYFYNRDVNESVDKGLKLLGPMMTVVLGGMLLLIMSAVLMPIYDIIGNMKF